MEIKCMEQKNNELVCDDIKTSITENIRIRDHHIKKLKERYENYKFKASSPILDIGGGDGSFLESQDISTATIIEGGIYKSDKYNYIKSDITKKLPEFKTKFKTIFLMEVLEHLKNPLYVLAQVWNLLEDDGVCYIAVPYTEIGTNHHHVCRWKLSELRNQVSKLGFRSRVIQKRRRLKGFGVFFPYCWVVLAIKKNTENSNTRNKEVYGLDID